MAQKRMFSKTITNSSQFLMMPESSQNLYFHLGMNADDDGFCEHFSVMRMVGSKPDDLKILQAKNYVQVFDERVLIILDWHENNLIRSDRYTPSKYISIYKEELKRLPSGIPTVAKRLPQVRLGKVRLGKDSKGKSDSTESSDYQNIVKEYFNLYEQRHQSKPVFGKTDGNIINTLLSSQSAHVILEKLRKFMKDDFWFTRDGSGRDLKKFRAHYNEIVIQAADTSTSTGSGYLNACLGSPDARKFKYAILTEQEKNTVIEKIGRELLQSEGLL